MVRKIKMKSKKKTSKALLSDTTKQTTTKVVKRRKFDGVNSITNFDYQNIDSLLGDYKNLLKKGYRINGKVCSGEDIKSLNYKRDTYGSVIEVYIEIVKDLYNYFGENRVYFMDAIASGMISNEDYKNKENLRKMDGMLSDLVKNFKYCRKILLPIHEKFHGHLMEMNMEAKKIFDYNSMYRRPSDNEISRSIDWFALYFSKKGLIEAMVNWDEVVLKDFLNKTKHQLIVAYS